MDSQQRKNKSHVKIPNKPFIDSKRPMGIVALLFIYRGVNYKRPIHLPNLIPFGHPKIRDLKRKNFEVDLNYGHVYTHTKVHIN